MWIYTHYTSCCCLYQGSLPTITLSESLITTTWRSSPFCLHVDPFRLTMLGATFYVCVNMRQRWVLWQNIRGEQRKSREYWSLRIGNDSWWSFWPLRLWKGWDHNQDFHGVKVDPCDVWVAWGIKRVNKNICANDKSGGGASAGLEKKAGSSGSRMGEGRVRFLVFAPASILETPSRLFHFSVMQTWDFCLHPHVYPKVCLLMTEEETLCVWVTWSWTQCLTDPVWGSAPLSFSQLPTEELFFEKK